MTSSVISRTDVWLAATNWLPQHATDTMLLELEPAARNRISRLEHSEDRRDSAAAHRLLRWLLGNRYDVPPTAISVLPRTGHTPVARVSGRRTDWAFSLSHTRGFVALAFDTAAPVGVDVEAIDGFRLPAEDVVELQRRLSVDTGKDVSAAEPQALASVWVCYEAALKAGHRRLTGRSEARIVEREFAVGLNTASTGAATRWHDASGFFGRHYS